MSTAAGQRTGFFRFDGHRIAFAELGSGRPPLVLAAWWVSNIVEDWKGEGFRRFIEGLARGRRVIRYDRLGCGMSDRERPRETLELDYEVAVLSALIDHLELERVTLVGGSYGGCTAVAYAARNPDRVDRLVLYGAFANGAELARAGTRQAVVELVRRHWGLGSRMFADAFLPSGDADERAAFAAFQRASASADFAGELLELTFATDVSETIAELQTPTMVVHRRHDRVVRLAAGEQLAALAPNAELVFLDGDAHLPWHGDIDSVLAAVAPFVGIEAPPAREAQTEVDELSPREREVLRLVAEGLSDGQIAERLVLSPHTVHRHVANIRRKLGMHSRAAAAAHAARAGLV
jgi:pimeloyl-ACP methyl ester carboxylesterase/DNA-binding CsgD family transcriptional regulator